MSHLDNEHLPPGNWQRIPVMSAADVDMAMGAGPGLAGQAHGRPVAESAIRHRRPGGTPGAMQQNIRPGSDPVTDPRGQLMWSEQELPNNGYLGGGAGFTGSTTQISAAELEQRDAALRGLYDQRQQPPARPTAQQLPDGTILLALPDGRQARMTPQQFHMVAQKLGMKPASPQQPTENLTSRLLRQIRGG